MCLISASLLQKLEELEDRLRVCRRDNLKYLQLARRCKAETEWLKGRLDATARASRGPRSCTCDISLKGYEKVVFCFPSPSEMGRT